MSNVARCSLGGLAPFINAARRGLNELRITWPLMPAFIEMAHMRYRYASLAVAKMMKCHARQVIIKSIGGMMPALVDCVNAPLKPNYLLRRSHTA